MRSAEGRDRECGANGELTPADINLLVTVIDAEIARKSPLDMED